MNNTKNTIKETIKKSVFDKNKNLVSGFLEHSKFRIDSPMSKCVDKNKKTIIKLIKSPFSGEMFLIKLCPQCSMKHEFKGIEVDVLNINNIDKKLRL